MIANNLKPADAGQGAASSPAVDEGSRARSASRRDRARGNDFSSVLRGLGADAARGASGQGRGAGTGIVVGETGIETADDRASVPIDGRRQKGRAGIDDDDRTGGDGALTSDWPTRDLAMATQAGVQGREEGRERNVEKDHEKGGAAGLRAPAGNTAAGATSLVAGALSSVAGALSPAAGALSPANGAGADEAATSRKPTSRTLDPARGPAMASAPDVAQAGPRPGKAADTAVQGAGTAAGAAEARRTAAGIGGAGVTAGIDGAAGREGKADRAGSDGRTVALRDVEDRQLDQRLAPGQTLADKAASAVVGTARRREDGVAVDRAAVERLVTERISVSRATGVDTAGIGAAGASASQADGEPAGGAATRRESPTARRPSALPSRQVAGDTATAERAASADAAARTASISTSTVELASAEGKALRSGAEREPVPGAAAPQARAQDPAVSLAPAPTLSMPTPSGVPTVAVEPSLTDPAFAQALGQQVRLLIDGEISVADMVVTPAEMGPVRIELTIRGDNADVVFTAAAPETLRAIEASGEVLRAMLAEQGISLGSMDVGQGQARSSSMANGDGASHRQHGADGTTPAASRGSGAESTAHTPSSAAHRRGIVDLIA